MSKANESGNGKLAANYKNRMAVSPGRRPCANLDCHYAAFSRTIKAVAVLEMAT